MQKKDLGILVVIIVYIGRASLIALEKFIRPAKERCRAFK